MDKQKVFNGADRIFEFYKLFEGKRIGLVTNPSGIDKNLVMTADKFKKHFDLRAMYSPEHGVRGNVQAGDHVAEYTDEYTNVKVFSIYGEYRYPKEEFLKDIDVMVYDIQDVGSRYYTYIYTMANCMIACAKYGKQFIILDRINIIGGENMEGNILDLKYRSFVGEYPIIQRYGLTIGELASFLNKEFNINADVQIVKVKGWSRELMLDDTDLTFVNPSPNIANLDAALLYNGTCLFEGSNLSEGRGTTRPFEIIGAPWINAYQFAEMLNSYGISGVKFRPVYFTPIYHKHKGEMCGGVQIHITDKKSLRPVELGVKMFYAAREISGNAFAYPPPRSEIGDYTIDLLMGNNLLRNMEVPCEDIIALIRDDTEKFKKLADRYKLY